MTQATAATMHGQATTSNGSTTKRPHRSEPTPRTLETRLQLKVDLARKYRGTVRFFEKRHWLLRAPKHRAWARATLRTAERRLARVRRDITSLRAQIERRETRRLAALPPRRAICNVFRSHCRAALAVAWCESRLDTRARNGQYLGLFQMGSRERALFGHGPTAIQQSRAAHRYFLRTGRTWRPWSCKPAYGS